MTIVNEYVIKLSEQTGLRVGTYTENIGLGVKEGPRVLTLRTWHTPSSVLAMLDGRWVSREYLVWADSFTEDEKTVMRAALTHLQLKE